MKVLKEKINGVVKILYDYYDLMVGLEPATTIVQKLDRFYRYLTTEDLTIFLKRAGFECDGSTWKYGEFTFEFTKNGFHPLVINFNKKESKPKGWDRSKDLQQRVKSLQARLDYYDSWEEKQKVVEKAEEDFNSMPIPKTVTERPDLSMTDHRIINDFIIC